MTAIPVEPPPGGVPKASGKAYYSIRRTLFEVDSKYVPNKAIGRGSYGIVCSATDLTTGEKVAIKKIETLRGNRIQALRTLREMALLRILKHPNVITLKDVMMPVQKLCFDDVYLVYELMQTDLRQVIASSQPLSNDHCKYFVYQILNGLKHIHACKVIHRDLKPGNLFMNFDSDLKIGDFGLARTAGREDEPMTEYVVTRWYRAPEVLISCDNYGASVDMWSVGCIMAEILGRKPIFRGKDYLNQLNLIIDTLGSPSASDLDFISDSRTRKRIESLPYRTGVKFSALFPDADPLALDLLEKLLVFDPRRRITAWEALFHPYMDGLYDPDIRFPAECTDEIKIFNIMDEVALRKMMYREFCHYETC